MCANDLCSRGRVCLRVNVLYVLAVSLRIGDLRFIRNAFSGFYFRVSISSLPGVEGELQRDFQRPKTRGRWDGWVPAGADPGLAAGARRFATWLGRDVGAAGGLSGPW